MNMSDLYAHLCQQLQQYRQQHLVLALSGGVDSRLLLALLVRYRDEFGVPLSAVHVHHGLSENADHWALQCQKWCDESSVEIAIEHVTLDMSGGDSIEKLARDARYQALSKHISQRDVLLVGQHADDQVETFLLALKRGSGPRGLASMSVVAPFSSGRLLRPLLTIKRSEIEACATELGLDWVTDESNSDTRFERNFIRHRITPVLHQRWPSIHQSVQRSAELCAEQDALLKELLESSLHAALEPDGSLGIEPLERQTESIRRQLIRQWLSSHQVMMPSRKHTDMIWHEVALAAADANPKLKISQSEVRRFEQRLYCVEAMEDVTLWKSAIKLDQELQLPDKLGVLKLTSGGGALRLPENAEQLWVSFNPQGLMACPVGRPGSRKLKKLFQEYSVPSWLRRRTPILMYQDKVVAVANLFVDRDFSGQDCELHWDK